MNRLRFCDVTGGLPTPKIKPFDLVAVCLKVISWYNYKLLQKDSKDDTIINWRLYQCVKQCLVTMLDVKKSLTGKETFNQIRSVSAAAKWDCRL